MNLAAVPAELQQRNQWVVWRLETVESGRTTKVPYSPIHGRTASVDDPSGWASWLLSNSALASGLFNGLGYEIAADDPYCFIDLDDPYAVDPATQQPKYTGDKLNTVLQLQAEVYNRFSRSYSEISPSGKGLHIITRGSVPTGKRKNGVEVYSSGRYMTVTGDVHRALPIMDAQADLDWLYQTLGGGINAPEFQGNTEDLTDDNTILARAYRALNGDKFAALWEGKWADDYPSQSEADFALVDMLVFYTSSVPQVKRLFRMSGLGQREKGQSDAPRVNGKSYVDHMIGRAFDRHLPPVDISAATAKMQAVLADQVAAEAEVSKIPKPVGVNPYGRPIPGLLGQIAYFIYAASPRPVTEIALAAAIGLMAGITGRAYNVSGTGLNQYIMLLAGTGRGKESIHTGIRRLMTQVAAVGPGGGGCPAAVEFLGPDDIASGQALVRYLSNNSKSFVTVQGEFDLTLNAFTQRHANAALLKLKQVLLKSYSRSGRAQVLEPSIYAESDKNTQAIVAPGVTLIGEGTPERFYNLLDEAMVADGLIPRFTIIHYDGDRVRRHKEHRQTEPPDALVRALASLCGQALMLNQSNSVIDVGYSPDAEKFLDAYDETIDRIINARHNVTTDEIWNRAHLKALKLAAVIAVGCNPSQPIISLEVAQYAVDVVNYDTRRLVAKFESGDIGDSESRQANDLRRIVQRLFANPPTEVDRALATSGVIAKRMLSQRSANMTSFRVDRMGATIALNRVLQTLQDAGIIQQLGPMETRQLGPQTAKLYKVLDTKWLSEGLEVA